MSIKLIPSIILLFFLMVPYGSAKTEQDQYRQECQYHTNVMWARYYYATYGLKDKAKTKAYYQAAFDEAEKYFTQHPQEPALSNKSIRLNLISLCNSMLDPYMDSAAHASNQHNGNGLSIATALIANEMLYGAAAQVMRKRIWKLYENAFGPQDEETKHAKKIYEDYQNIRKQINQIPKKDIALLSSSRHSNFTFSVSSIECRSEFTVEP